MKNNINELSEIIWKAQYQRKEGTNSSYLFSAYIDIDKIKNVKEKSEANINCWTF